MKNQIKELLIPFYYFIWENYILIRNNFLKKTYTNAYDIPIIINNRNRVTFLKQMISSLESKGYHNIYIIDNKSSYQPLLDYYKKSKHKIFYLDENVGFLSLWKSGIYKQFKNNFFVYSDSDVVPTENCPHNFLQIFLDKMYEDKKIMKIGLSLKIDDLPDYFKNKKEVIDWESQYFEKQEDGLYYNANVDTTFALYRPFMSGGASRLKMFRSKKPMEAYHMPWYNDSSNLSEEELFYINSAKTSTHWTSK
nr:glycosyltransferase [uncultured Flavobacterium sp.]